MSQVICENFWWEQSFVMITQANNSNRPSQNFMASAYIKHLPPSTFLLLLSSFYLTQNKSHARILRRFFLQKMDGHLDMFFRCFLCLKSSAFDPIWSLLLSLIKNLGSAQLMCHELELLRVFFKAFYPAHCQVNDGISCRSRTLILI